MTILCLLREKSNLQNWKAYVSSCYSSPDSPFTPPLLLLLGSISFPSASLYSALAKFNTLKDQHCDTFRRYPPQSFLQRDFFKFFGVVYSALHHLLPSDSTVSEAAGNEPRTVETLALVVRYSNHVDTSNHLFKVLECLAEFCETTTSYYKFAVQDWWKRKVLKATYVNGKPNFEI